MPSPPNTPILSVGELTFHIKQILEKDPVLSSVEVSGEVSNLTYHGSGHVYFSIKDADAQLSCVMFRSYAQQAERMREGDQVILKGSLSVYAPRGNYQLMVTSVRKAGLGDLFQRFVALKEKLEREGVFSVAHKKPLPFFPQKIAVITSPTGAAIRDILRTLRRRYDLLKVIVIPTVVQGTLGAASIVRSLKSAQDTGADLVILARGGGSIEDLWNFNEEKVARAIYDCSIPVITGIGHETDFTIADFVSDLRASTPTAAAEHAVPDKANILATLDEYQRQMQHSLQYFIDFKRQVLDDYGNRLQEGLQRYLVEKRHDLSLLEAQLNAGDPTGILDKGYTLTLKEGIIQHSSAGIEPGDEIETVFADGRLSSQIQTRKPSP